MEYWRLRSTCINRRVLYKKGRNTLCVSSRNYCKGSSNCQGHGTTVSTRVSSTRACVGVKWIICCTSSKHVSICWWQFSMFVRGRLIILTNNVIQFKWLKSELEKEFEMSNFGELHYYLEVEFERNKEACTITMNQKSYIKKALKHLHMEECKPVGILFDANSKLFQLLDEEFENVQRKIEGASYKIEVGSLMYAMMGMRANLAFAVSMVSQFMLEAGPLY